MADHTYLIDEDGWVRLRGVRADPPGTVFQLPRGYRPAPLSEVHENSTLDLSALRPFEDPPEVSHA